MKRNILAIASLLALTAGAAQAQSSVTLYGLVDTGVERLSNAGAGGDTVYRMPTLAGSFASRWGFRGAEDLGGGLKAVFTLESGFGADSGVFQQANRLFGRQAYVGLSGDWGTLSFGRHYSMLLWGTLPTETLFASIYGEGSFDVFLAAPRVDNSISYLGKFAGFQFGATYSFGQDGNSSGGANCPGERPSDHKECTGYSAMVRYDTKEWGVGAFIDQRHGRNNVDALPVPAATDFSSAIDRHWEVNGFVTLAGVKLAAAWQDRQNELASAALPVDSRIWRVTAAYNVTPAVMLEAQYINYSAQNAVNPAVEDNDANLIVLRATYGFSKRTFGYVTSGIMNNKGTANFSPSVATTGTGLGPLAGKDQTGVMIGLRHSF